MGFLGFWRRDFWLPFLVAKAAFSWTAGAAHVIDLIGRGNAAVGNAGPILYLDFLVPVVLIVIYAVYARALGEPAGAVRIRPLSTRRSSSNGPAPWRCAGHVPQSGTGATGDFVGT